MRSEAHTLRLPPVVGLIALALGRLAGSEVPADAAGPVSLTLAEAEQRAVEHNWEQLAVRRDVAIADAQRMTAREFPNPSASVITTHINTDGRGNPAQVGNKLWDRSYDSVFSLTQPLEIGGKRAARQASALAGYEAARAQFADARRTLTFAVVRAYVAAALADATARIAAESAGYLRAQANVATTRLGAGDIAQFERDRIEIAARQMELQAQTARAVAAGQRVALEVLLGFENPRGGVGLRDDVESLAKAELPALSRHPLNRPDLIQAEQALRKAEADLRLQRAMRIPDPALVVQYEHQPPDASNSVGVGVSFPLPLWSRNRGGIRAATMVRDQVALAVRKIRAQIAADFATSQVTYDEAFARWHDYTDNVRPRAERVRQSVSLAYEKGGVSLLDLLEAQRADNDVRVAAVQAAADAVIARAARQAAGSEFVPETEDYP